MSHNQLHKCNELNYANYGAALFNHLSIDSIVAFIPSILRTCWNPEPL